VLASIRAFLARHGATPTADSTGPAAPDAVRVAACALLLEVAHADGEFTADERAHIESAVGRHFGLDDDTRDELLHLAEEERRQSVDHFQFTSVINEHYDLGQKMVLAELMWGVIMADGTIAAHESYLVRKLANLLDLPPAYLNQARRQAAPPDAID